MGGRQNQRFLLRLRQVPWRKRRPTPLALRDHISLKLFAAVDETGLGVQKKQAKIYSGCD